MADWGPTTSMPHGSFAATAWHACDHASGHDATTDRFCDVPLIVNDLAFVCSRHARAASPTSVVNDEAVLHRLILLVKRGPEACRAELAAAVLEGLFDG